MFLVSIAFISACSIGIAIISGLDNGENESLEMKVDSNPSKAAVHLNGKKLGTTPITFKIIGFNKTHKIEISKNGYQTKIIKVFVSSRNTELQEYSVLSKYDGVWSQVQNNTFKIVLESDWFLKFKFFKDKSPAVVITAHIFFNFKAWDNSNLSVLLKL